MLDVDVEKILPITEARDNLNKIIDDVENDDDLYVLTKNGRPSAIICGVKHMETLTGIKHGDLTVKDDIQNESGSPAAQNSAFINYGAQNQQPLTDDTNTSDDNSSAFDFGNASQAIASSTPTAQSTQEDTTPAPLFQPQANDAPENTFKDNFSIDQPATANEAPDIAPAPVNEPITEEVPVMPAFEPQAEPPISNPQDQPTETSAMPATAATPSYNDFFAPAQEEPQPAAPVQPAPAQPASSSNDFNIAGVSAIPDLNNLNSSQLNNISTNNSAPLQTPPTGQQQ